MWDKKYDELTKRKGFLNQLSFYWFVLCASLRDIGKKKKIKEESFWFPSYFILHVEIPPQPAPSFPENTTTNSSQFDTLKVKYRLLVKYILTPTQKIVENLVAILAIRRELKGIERPTPCEG